MDADEDKAKRDECQRQNEAVSQVRRTTFDIIRRAERVAAKLSPEELRAFFEDLSTVANRHLAPHERD